MRENIVKSKSYAFAVRIVKMFKFLLQEQKEFVLSKQELVRLLASIIKTTKAKN